jgi:hypothetical protein
VWWGKRGAYTDQKKRIVGVWPKRKQRDYGGRPASVCGRFGSQLMRRCEIRSRLCSSARAFALQGCMKSKCPTVLRRLHDLGQAHGWKVSLRDGVFEAVTGTCPSTGNWEDADLCYNSTVWWDLTAVFGRLRVYWSMVLDPRIGKFRWTFGSMTIKPVEMAAKDWNSEVVPVRVFEQGMDIKVRDAKWMMANPEQVELDHQSKQRERRKQWLHYLRCRREVAAKAAALAQPPTSPPPS